MKQDDVVKFLLDAPEEQLVDVLEAVFRQRVPAPEESSYCDNRYCLAIAWRDKKEEVGQWEPSELHVAAYLNREKYPDGAPDLGLCQEGTCPECCAIVRSNGKHGYCPVCFSDGGFNSEAQHRVS